MWRWLVVPTVPGAVKGRAFQRSSGTAHSGVIFLDDNEIVFQGASASVRFPLQGLKMSRNRWTGGAITLEHRAEPDWRLSVRDNYFLAQPRLRDDARLAAQAQHCRPVLWRARKAIRIGAAIFLLAFIFVPPFHTATVRQGIRLVSVKSEISMGQGIMNSIAQDTPLLHDPLLDAGMREISEQLASHIPPQPNPYHFQIFVIANPEVNAFAVPGGFVAVYTGLIEQAQSPEELAGVIGHEFAHVTRRHALAQMAGQIGVIALLDASVGGDVDFPIGVAAVLADQRFSRQHESEADADALAALRAAGIAPEPFIAFFERLELERKMEEEESQLSPHLRLALALLDSHPAPAERIEALRKLAHQTHPAQAGTPFKFDFEAFKRRAKELEAASEKHREEL